MQPHKPMFGCTEGIRNWALTLARACKNALTKKKLQHGVPIDCNVKFGGHSRGQSKITGHADGGTIGIVRTWCWVGVIFDSWSNTHRGLLVRLRAGRGIGHRETGRSDQQPDQQRGPLLHCTDSGGCPPDCIRGAAVSFSEFGLNWFPTKFSKIFFSLSAPFSSFKHIKVNLSLFLQFKNTFRRKSTPAKKISKRWENFLQVLFFILLLDYR